MTKERKTFRPLTSENVFVAYKLLRNNGLVSFEPPHDAEQKVESATSTVTSNYYGYKPYPTASLQAAACLYYIINAHAFTDGNKRTAVLTMVAFCSLNKVKILLPLEKLDELAVFIEEHEISDREVFIRDICKVMFSQEE